MNEIQTRTAIPNGLASFATKPLAEAATSLFETLGYKWKPAGVPLLVSSAENVEFMNTSEPFGGAVK